MGLKIVYHVKGIEVLTVTNDQAYDKVSGNKDW
jgi:hypothetical protein